MVDKHKHKHKHKQKIKQKYKQKIKQKIATAKKSKEFITNQDIEILFNDPMIDTLEDRLTCFYKGDLPTHYHKGKPNPCPKCRRILIEKSRGKATLVTSSRDGISYFRCKVCHFRWGLPNV